MKEKKFTVGQEVWVMGGSKYDTELKKRAVTKVGRKYVTLSSGKKYDVESHQEVRESGENGYLYLSEQEYEDEQELAKNKTEIASYLSFFTAKAMTVEQSRAILAILEGGVSE